MLKHLFCIPFLLLFTSPLGAVIVAHEFTAKTVETDGLTRDTVPLGETISGIFQYSTDASDGEGFAGNGIFAFNLSFGSTVITADFNDLIRLATGGPGNQSGFAFNVSFDLDDTFVSHGSAVVAFSGPIGTFQAYPSSIDLEPLYFKYVELSYDDHYIRADLETVSTSVVPESTPLLLLSFSAVILCGLGLTRRCS